MSYRSKGKIKGRNGEDAGKNAARNREETGEIREGRGRFGEDSGKNAGIPGEGDRGLGVLGQDTRESPICGTMGLSYPLPLPINARH